MAEKEKEAANEKQIDEMAEIMQNHSEPEEEIVTRPNRFLKQLNKIASHEETSEKPAAADLSSIINSSSVESTSKLCAAVKEQSDRVEGGIKALMEHQEKQTAQKSAFWDKTLKQQAEHNEALRRSIEGVCQSVTESYKNIMRQSVSSIDMIVAKTIKQALARETTDALAAITEHTQQCFEQNKRRKL